MGCDIVHGHHQHAGMVVRIQPEPVGGASALRQSEAELQLALDGLIAAGLLFRRDLRPLARTRLGA